MNTDDRELAIVNYVVKAGHVIPVYNKDRKVFSNAKKVYNSIWVEDAKGKNERCLLFTDNELKCFDVEIIGWPMVLGRLYKIVEGNIVYYFVKLFYPETKKNKIIKISSTNLKKAEYRSYRNPEDLTEKNFWIDITD